MWCDWDDIPGHPGRYRCKRCDWVTEYTPDPKEMTDRNCTAFPRWHELGHWLTFIFAAMFVTKGDCQIVARAFGYGCGCQQREEQANTCGARFAAWLRS